MIAIAAVALGVIVPFLGCTAGVNGTAECSATWVPAPWNLFIAPALTGLALFIKGYGSPGTTVGENLTNKSVPVTTEAKPGTVTPAQVAKAG